MSAKQRDDAKPPPEPEVDADEREHDEEEALDAMAAAIEDATTRHQRAIEREEAGNERLEKYPEVLWALSDLVYPLANEDSLTPRRRLRRLDPVLRNEVELALTAIARDIRRIASATGPRDLKPEGA